MFLYLNLQFWYVHCVTICLHVGHADCIKRTLLRVEKKMPMLQGNFVFLALNSSAGALCGNKAIAPFFLCCIYLLCFSLEALEVHNLSTLSKLLEKEKDLHSACPHESDQSRLKKAVDTVRSRMKKKKPVVNREDVLRYFRHKNYPSSFAVCECLNIFACRQILPLSRTSKNTSFPSLIFACICFLVA